MSGGPWLIASIIQLVLVKSESYNKVTKEVRDEWLLEPWAGSSSARKSFKLGFTAVSPLHISNTLN